VQRGELPGLPSRPPEARQHLLVARSTMRTSPVHPVDHVDVPLRRVRREHQIVDRAVAERRLLEDVLGDEGAVLAKDLHPVVGAVANVNETVLAEPDAVHRIAELL
jgi:hypothetical protein